MKEITARIALATSIAIASTTAFAVPITIEVVEAGWSNVVGGSNVSNYVDASGNAILTWGGTSGSKSGYEFDPAAPPAFTVETGDIFSLGDFTHNNFPIPAGTAISGAQLDITANLLIDGTHLLGEGPYNFSFLHNETPNSCSGMHCSNDIVSFSNLATSDTFDIGGQIYTLELAGFSVGGMIVDEFSTVEGQANTAQLSAVFRAPTTTVPEPASLLMLGLGLVGLGLNRVRSRG